VVRATGLLEADLLVVGRLVPVSASDWLIDCTNYGPICEARQAAQNSERCRRMRLFCLGATKSIKDVTNVWFVMNNIQFSLGSVEFVV